MSSKQLLLLLVIEQTFTAILLLWLDYTYALTSLTTSAYNYVQVGCMLRTPLQPIWITKVNGSYGLFFCTSKDLVADWKTERYFSVHYYIGHDAQVNPTCISIGKHYTQALHYCLSYWFRILTDTRKKACLDPSMEISYWDDEQEKERKQPSLERLLGTKWPDALIDWNGESPYYWSTDSTATPPSGDMTLTSE